MGHHVGLARQDSNTSLPTAQTRPRRHKLRLSYSLRRIRRRRRNSADVLQVPTLPDELKALGEAQVDFEQFTVAVVEDLTIKLANLKRFKLSESATIHERSYATLQIFMLQKYSNRIASFKNVSTKSIENICRKFEENEPMEKLQDYVDQFKSCLAKMKTRMKHMIDVSDKYAVIEIFDTINIFNKVSNDLDCTETDENQIENFVSLENISNSSPASLEASTTRKCSDFSMTSISSFGWSPEDRNLTGNVKTFRSLSDHVCVLGKTYVTSVYKSMS